MDGSDLFETRYVLIKFWVNRHMFRSHSKPLSVLVLGFDMQNERNARRIDGHHLLQVLHVEMYAFHDDAFVAHVRTLDHFAQLVLNQF